MKDSLIALAGALLIAHGTLALAASSVDLSVKGAITPSACTPSINQGGLVDFGKIPAKHLSADTTTPLPSTVLKLGVNCDGATFFALRGIDNRLGTAYLDDGYNYGLGVANGDPTQKLGMYFLTLSNAVSDIGPLDTLMSQDGGKFWWNFQSYYWLVSHLWVAFGSSIDGIAAPIAVRQVTADLQVYAWLAPSRGLDLNEQISLDGFATVELIYL
ncbi:DUF1120 domain-containing protein [Pseudomonas sp. SDO524_S393]